MTYWLLKSEPNVYSFSQFIKDKKTAWTGIRNYAARLHLKNMKKGDLAFFYHSNTGTEIVGICKIIKEAYQDPTTEDTRWVAVDIEFYKSLSRAVTLAEIKNEKVLQQMALIRISRLSVQPVNKLEWEKILSMQ